MLVSAIARYMLAFDAHAIDPSNTKAYIDWRLAALDLMIEADPSCLNRKLDVTLNR